MLGVIAFAILALAPGASAFNFTTIDVPGALITAPFGINKAGRVVGGSIDETGAEHGFLRQKDGSFVTIDVPGALATEPHGINDSGRIAGVYLDQNLQQRGFLLHKGTLTTFDVPFPEATDTIGWGINKAGQIVGYYLDTDAVPHGFLRQPDGGFSAIDAPGAFIVPESVIEPI